MTVKTTRRGLLGLLAGSLTACTAEGPAYRPDSVEPTATTGVIYVYRPKGTVATRGESPFVTIGGKSYGQIKAGSYVAANVPEGEAKVMLQQSLFLLVPTIPRWVTVTVVAGGTSYVRVDQKISGADLSSGVTVNQSILIEEVSSEVGQAELAETRQN
jgi:hypothetical protein